MPQRFLRPGITNSERWNSVPFDAQSLYIRILTLVDDYGRCDGRAPVILGQCFSIWNALHQNDPTTCCNLQQVSQMLHQLAAENVHLLSIYETDGKTVLQVSQWQERVREGVKEKWPPNPLLLTKKLAATCSNLLPSPPSSPPLYPVPALILESSSSPAPAPGDSLKLSPTAQAIKNQTELKRVEARMDTIRNQATTTATGKLFTQLQVVELATLKNRRQFLLDSLNFKA